MHAHLADFMGLSPAKIAALVAMAAAIYSVTRWRRYMISKRKPQEESQFQAKAAPMNMRVVNAEVEALLGEVEETTRRLTAQIDNRYQRLEQLMAEADEKIARLERLTQGAATANVPTSEGKRDAERVLSRLREERGAPAANDDPAYQPIYSLADGGKTPREIAQELGRQPGEIELILALRQR